jgi:hypothetical protein
LVGTGRGFGPWWRWKSRDPGGRPKVDCELRDLIHRMCNENALWGAPRIHGELLKLGFTVAQSTVSKYMPRRRKPPSQGWKTFVKSHADGIAAVDFLVVPTLAFERLFAFVVLGLGRRKISWIGVTTDPTAEWLARQITEAFPWDTAPRFLIRDNDGAYGEVFMHRLRSMAIRDRPITPRSPWRTEMSNGSSVQSGENVTTMSLCGMSRIFSASSTHTHIITTRRGPTWAYARMPQTTVQSSAADA